MTIADERILEFLSENDSGTPSSMANSEFVRFSRPHIHERCQKLKRHGLIRFLGNGVYIITDEGLQYLDGDLDAAELRADED